MAEVIHGGMHVYFNHSQNTCQLPYSERGYKGCKTNDCMYMPIYEALWDIYHLWMTINGILSDKSDITVVLNHSKNVLLLKTLKTCGVYMTLCLI